MLIMTKAKLQKKVKRDLSSGNSKYLGNWPVRHWILCTVVYLWLLLTSSSSFELSGIEFERFVYKHNKTCTRCMKLHRYGELKASRKSWSWHVAIIHDNWAVELLCIWLQWTLCNDRRMIEGEGTRNILCSQSLVSIAVHQNNQY